MKVLWFEDFCAARREPHSPAKTVSNPSFDGQVRNKRKLYQPGPRVLPAENRLNVSAPQGMQVCSPVLTARQKSLLHWLVYQ